MNTRPSKKQRELFAYIDSFIKGNGYGPSYREIMRALDYKSVSTVAVHIDALIAHGLLRKKDNSARSLEVIGIVKSRSANVDWLASEVEKRKNSTDPQMVKDASTLAAALEILQKESD